ncbi:putative Serine/threonine-protein phosphatase 2A activator [Paratrimastix pyriformis]|uniref:peptidylprolyl isomerase n=1 Tax=Paratrimastix pyriformis TaxID=342808 RepID=A0ABQ8UD62_9EUKA|nr:putative Serine/threonine-protein phosphatase 2A activator [Paratrimastix pyriformis]
MSTANKPILVYFGGRGRAEAIRLCLAEAGIDYEDQRVSFEAWPSMKSTLPFGQLPVLRIDGISIAQSMACVRYVAHKYGLVPSDPVKAGQCDMFCEAIEDLVAQTFKVTMTPGTTDAEKTKFRTETLPSWLASFERLLGDKEYLVGTFSYADLVVFNYLQGMTDPAVLDIAPLPLEVLRFCDLKFSTAVRSPSFLQDFVPHSVCGSSSFSLLPPVFLDDLLSDFPGISTGDHSNNPPPSPSIIRYFTLAMLPPPPADRKKHNLAQAPLGDVRWHGPDLSETSSSRRSLEGRLHPQSGARQLQAASLARWATTLRANRADVCDGRPAPLVAVTLEDLYTDPGDLYVAGLHEASSTSPVPPPAQQQSDQMWIFINPPSSKLFTPCRNCEGMTQTGECGPGVFWELSWFHPTGGVDRLVHMASQFVVPGKVIRSPIDLHKFQASQAYVVLLNFVVTVNEEISGKKLSYLIPRAVSPLALRVMDLLDDLTSSIEQFPPYTQPQRFGNRAYRDWHGHLVANSETMLRRLLGELDPATVELRPYLEDSFGNPTRIDYGTGHETAFIAFLCCLWRLGHLGPSDVQFFGLRVFPKYLSVCRTLQQRYSMEPAGTRGAWGLDDFHFFPFLWGSAQLIGSAIPPDSVLQDGFLQANGNEFIYVDAVRHITRVRVAMWSVGAPGAVGGRQCGTPGTGGWVGRRGPHGTAHAPQPYALYAPTFHAALTLALISRADPNPRTRPQVKQGPFFEHSPVLYNITAVPS